MTRQEDWGLRFLLAGGTLGLVVLGFVGAFDSSSFYQTYVASAPLTEALPPLGYLLDVGGLLALALILVGVACFSSGPWGAEMPRSAQARQVPRAAAGRGAEAHPPPAKGRQPSAPHGST